MHLRLCYVYGICILRCLFASISKRNEDNYIKGKNIFELKYIRNNSKFTQQNITKIWLNSIWVVCGTMEVTNSMEQNSYWEANSCLPSQEMFCLLWNPKVHYGVHKSPPLVPSQINPVHTFLPNFQDPTIGRTAYISRAKLIHSKQSTSLRSSLIHVLCSHICPGLQVYLCYEPCKISNSFVWSFIFQCMPYSWQTDQIFKRHFPILIFGQYVTKYIIKFYLSLQVK
jgi:hypothetical protein